MLLNAGTLAVAPFASVGLASMLGAHTPWILIFHGKVCGMRRVRRRTRGGGGKRRHFVSLWSFSTAGGIYVRGEADESNKIKVDKTIRFLISELFSLSKSNSVRAMMMKFKERMFR